MKKGGSQEKSVILSIFPFVAEKSFGSSGSAGTIGTSYANELLFAERKAAATAPFPAGLRPQQGVGGPCPRCGTLLLWMAIGGKGSICRPRCQPPEKSAPSP